MQRDLLYKDRIYSQKKSEPIFIVCRGSKPFSSTVEPFLKRVWCALKQTRRTSIARTLLEPRKFVRDMDSSGHWGLIMAQGQEANWDLIVFFFSIFYTIIVC